MDGYCGGNPDNVYCYTFAAPNTFYYTDNGEERDSTAISGHKVIENYKEPKGARYRCIFNIVNDDDFVPKLPMEACQWTKYGRTASVSLNNIIHNEKGLSLAGFNYKTSHEFDEYSMPITNYERYLFSKYLGNNKSISQIIKEFNSIYDNKDSMRRETYFSSSDLNINKIYKYNTKIANNAKPYQKIVNENISYQVQTPAYFMQNVAHSMHEYKDKATSNSSDNTETDSDPDPGSQQLAEYDVIFGNKNKKEFYFLPLAKRYETAKNKIIDVRNHVEYPHMLESYYTLSKEITTTDFK